MILIVLKVDITFNLLLDESEEALKILSKRGSIYKEDLNSRGLVAWYFV
ncbi:hypothetical protein GCM10008968_19280 [Bacillus horti]